MIRYLVLLVNSHDLCFAQQDAELVAQAAVRCGLCREERVVRLFDKTGAEIEKALKDLVTQLAEFDQVLLWYSGHGYGKSEEGNEARGWTLIVPKGDEVSSAGDFVYIVWSR